MTEVIWVLLIISALTSGYALGYLLGSQRAIRDAAAQERLARRIAPPRRTPGLPTNAGAPPAEVRKARWRNGTFSDRQRKEW